LAVFNNMGMLLLAADALRDWLPQELQSSAMQLNQA
jgi:hypothetical protein